MLAIFLSNLLAFLGMSAILGRSDTTSSGSESPLSNIARTTDQVRKTSDTDPAQEAPDSDEPSDEAEDQDAKPKTVSTEDTPTSEPDVVEPSPDPDPEPFDPGLDVESLLSMTDRAFGLDDPAVAVGLGSIADWQPGMQALDLMKFSRPVLANEAGVWGVYSYDDLKEAGHLDENGWVKSLPDGDRVGATYNFSIGQTAEYEGSYVLQYDGTGSISVTGSSVKVTSEEPGRIEFTVTVKEDSGNSIFINVSDPDTEGTGDYIRNISMVREEHIELHEAGALFNPEYVGIIEDLREVRFMDWGKTNNSDLSEWEDRPTLDTAQWTIPGQGGVPIEAMVQLANEAGVDMWINMPLHATDEYIANAAAYVRDNLDPELRVTVEFSNELWNGAFTQTQEIWKMAEDDWGLASDDWAGKFAYSAKKATESAIIWKDTFGEDGEGRLEAVLGTHAARPWVTEQLLEANAWFENEPDTAVSPADVFDALAITTYFGTSVVTNEDSRLALLDAIADPDVDEYQYLYDLLTSPDAPSSIPDTYEKWKAQAALAEEYGLKLTAYEGGQHVHHTFNTGLTTQQQEDLGEFMQAFVRSDEMADLYQDLWEIWQEIGDGPFMQFTDVDRPADTGSWGLLSGLNDTNPRAEFIFDVNTETPWWEDRGGDQFKQGIIESGDAEGNLLVGTYQEDYLIGKGGDDILVGGDGDDGLHGGDGQDLVVVGGQRADYEIVANENGWYDLIHEDGTDRLVDVEHVMFSDQVLSLADMKAVDFEELEAKTLWTALTEGHGVHDETKPAEDEDASDQAATLDI